MLPEDRNMSSIRSAWYNRIQPIVNKFCAICERTPPSSGQLKVDQEMDLYYAQRRKEYCDSARGGLPKNINLYMLAYKFLSNHPKYASVLVSETDIIGRTKKGSGSGKKPARKVPSAASRAERPVGRDSAKNQAGMDLVVDKVSKQLEASMTSTPSDVSANNALFARLADGLSSATNVMSNLANHQVMAMAPESIREQYFSDYIKTMQMEVSTKRQRMELEQEEMKLRREKLEVEKAELAARKAALRSVADGDWY